MYTFIDNPEAGDPTELETLQTLINNQADMNSRLNSTNSDGIVNGSFENDGDEDGVPDGWDYAADDGGSGEISTTSHHGGYSYSMTAASGHGGANLTSTALIPVTPSTAYSLRFDTYSTNANMSNKVELLWYTKDANYISTGSVWDETAENPAAWATRSGTVTSPATATYAKVKVSGGYSPSNAGTVYFDDVAFVEQAFQGIQQVFTSSTTWTCPASVLSITVDGIGAGGGGGGGESGGTTGGNGGGAGAFKRQVVSTYPGETYTITVGSGGAAGATGSAGSDGSPSQIILGETVVYNVNAGGGGGTYDGDPGAGGVEAFSATIIGISGDDGSDNDGGAGGDGGAANAEPFPSTGGAGGSGSGAGTDGSAGTGYGSGGGGGGKDNDGGAGADGLLCLVY